MWGDIRDLSSESSSYCSVLLLLLLSTGLCFLGGRESLHCKGVRCSSIAAVGEVRAHIFAGCTELRYVDQHGITCCKLAISSRPVASSFAKDALQGSSLSWHLREVS